MFVLDASVTTAWCLQDEQDPYAMRVLDALENEPGIVAAIWPEELANVLLVSERRGRLTVTEATGWLGRIRRLPITVEPSSIASAFDVAQPLARQRQLSVYDASYLALAIRETLPLATLDKDLRRAALQVGVP